METHTFLSQEYAHIADENENGIKGMAGPESVYNSKNDYNDRFRVSWGVVIGE